jgi:hypothetical protein
MTYYRDLTDYEYHRAFYRPGTKNVGWLGVGLEFDVAAPTEELLSRLWGFCKISVAQTRGIHECEFCPGQGQSSYFAERNGEHLLLGTAEIRVFSKTDGLYAAPTLIYHYVKVHKYRPPDEFVQALTDGPAPPSEEYFARLAKLNLEWSKTSAPETNPVRFSLKSSSGS